MLFTGWEVKIEKYIVGVSKTARRRRPRDVFETKTKYHFWTVVRYREIPPAAAANQIAENARIPPVHE